MTEVMNNPDQVPVSKAVSIRCEAPGEKGDAALSHFYTSGSITFFGFQKVS
jgi:hypothetical protein